jgi:hypothetical protein
MKEDMEQEDAIQEYLTSPKPQNLKADENSIHISGYQLSKLKTDN